MPTDAVVLFLAVAVLGADLIGELATGTWQLEDHSYSPLIFLMGLGMAATVGLRMPGDVARRPRAAGWVPLVAALLLFVGARAIGNPFVAYGCLLAVAASAILLVAGWQMLRRFALPLVALVFAAPLPGAAVTAITFPLKLEISRWAVALLHLGSFPVARDGVLIEIGNYQLLVAEACSGLQSMFSLVAVAALYSFMVAPGSLRRAVALMAASLPIVFMLNVLRVVALALITYWFGGAAGEGFLHSAAGIAMFALALLALMALDRLAPQRGAVGA